MGHILRKIAPILSLSSLDLLFLACTHGSDIAVILLWILCNTDYNISGAKELNVQYLSLKNVKNRQETTVQYVQYVLVYLL